jgi:hypothetical protein
MTARPGEVAPQQVSLPIAKGVVRLSYCRKRCGLYHIVPATRAP